MIEYVLGALLIGFLFLRYKSGAPIFSAFSGMLSLWFALDFASVPYEDMMLTTIFALFAVLMFADGYIGFRRNE